jgi:hypothetical protein
LDKNTIILIEAPDGNSKGLTRASNAPGDVVRTKAQKSFADALKDIKVQAKMLLNEIDELHVEEAEVKFGINTVGELGNMAIGKIGLGVNYEITLKWKKSEAKS